MSAISAASEMNANWCSAASPHNINSCSCLRARILVGPHSINVDGNYVLEPLTTANGNFSTSTVEQENRQQGNDRCRQMSSLQQVPKYAAD